MLYVHIICNIYIYICVCVCEVRACICVYMEVDQNIVAGVLLEMTLRFLALFSVFIVFHCID